MIANPAALIGAISVSVTAAVHGIVGHRWFMTQLGTAEMRLTDISRRLFGEREDYWRVFGVAWHSLTLMFVSFAVVLYLAAFGALGSPELVRFVAILNTAELALGGVYFNWALDSILAPVPLLFTVTMVTTTTCAWIAIGSV